MEKNAKIYVAGSTGLVGGAIVRRLQNEGYANIITRTRHELDLTDKQAVNLFYSTIRPEYVIVSAAKVGGIKANMSYPAEFLYENLEIQNNLIWWAHLSGVTKLLFLGSSCIYPRECPQPMKEEYLMTGKLEPTNEGYALAKIAGMRLCEYISKEFGRNFISCMPTNIYGPGDHFDAERGHVIPAMIQRMHTAKLAGDTTFGVWGTGSARREFLYVDDLAEVVLYLLDHYTGTDFLNIWTGEDASITELTHILMDIMDYHPEIIYDTTKPDGMPRKLLDVTHLTETGWKYRTPLIEWLQHTYEYFLNNKLW
jgi:GDP-L-fucose synthase